MDRVLYYIFAIINIASFLLMFIDKYNAERKLWRVPEDTMFIFAIAFGALGIYLGMYIFKHKTRKPQFYYLMPVLAVIEVIAIGAIGTFVL